MHVLILRPYRKDNIYFRTIEEREKIMLNKYDEGVFVLDDIRGLSKTFVVCF